MRLIFFFMLLLCSSFGHAELASIPTCETLLMRGIFPFPKPWFKPWYENHYGESLDLSARRPAVNLAGTIFDLKYGRPGTYLMGNFYHAGRFYIVRIPNKAVRHLYFHLSYFPPKILGRYVAAHSLNRLELDPSMPLELVTEMPDENFVDSLQGASAQDAIARLPEPLDSLNPRHRLLNIVISAEASFTKTDKNPSYNLVRGALGAFMQIDRFESMEVRIEDFLTKGEPVSEFFLELPPDLRERALSVALATSEQDGLSRLYDTFNYNCTTKAFQIIESVIGPDPRLGFIRKFFERRVPILAPFKLKADGSLFAYPLETQLNSQSLAMETAIAVERLKAMGVSFDASLVQK